MDKLIHNVESMFTNAKFNSSINSDKDNASISIFTSPKKIAKIHEEFSTVCIENEEYEKAESSLLRAYFLLENDTIENNHSNSNNNNNNLDDDSSNRMTKILLSLAEVRSLQGKYYYYYY